MSDYLIYGANGYTGLLTARHAVARGHRPILAGRSPDAVRTVAEALGLPWRAFGLGDPAELHAGLAGVTVVLHCAGPFARTSGPMVRACLRAGVHYLDITGEIGVFEALAALDSQARAAGLMVLPGVGFDVVPSDCLAAHLKRRLPTATHLTLGFQMRGGVSRGTANTMAESAAPSSSTRGGAVRREGRIVPVPACYRTRVIDFGRGPCVAMTIPWGDVSTAWYSTGIPNIEVYMAAPPAARMAARASRYLGWLLGSRWGQKWLKARIAAGPPGPTDEQRATGASLLWGEARDDHGGRVVSRLRGPEGYTLTALTSLAVVERVLAGTAPPGFQTPSRAYGADFVLEVAGVVRTDAAG